MAKGQSLKNLSTWTYEEKKVLLAICALAEAGNKAAVAYMDKIYDEQKLIWWSPPAF